MGLNLGVQKVKKPISFAWVSSFFADRGMRLLPSQIRKRTRPLLFSIASLVTLSCTLSVLVEVVFVKAKNVILNDILSSPASFAKVATLCGGFHFCSAWQV